MRNALPNAAFIGFTGTPLIAGEEERTREVFGDYVSRLQLQPIDRGRSTVPLYYENRIPELQLTNDELNEDMDDVARRGRAGRRSGEEARARVRAANTTSSRATTVWRQIADDIVAHFMGRGFHGKAMVISIDKATAVRMYDKVRITGTRNSRT